MGGLGGDGLGMDEGGEGGVGGRVGVWAWMREGVGVGGWVNFWGGMRD